MTRWLGLLAALVLSAPALGAGGEKPVERTYVTAPPAPYSQTQGQADAKSAGCMTCHTAVDQPSMHDAKSVVLGCTDCHGGNANVRWGGKGHQPGTPGYKEAMEQAHVLPRYPEFWGHAGAANPERSYAQLNKEAPEFIRFMNPSDYRVAREACGACHLPVIQAAERSLMATNAMFWGIVTYNNGILPYKDYILGESYTRDGKPAVLKSPVFKKTDQTYKNRILDVIYPMPRWEVIPPADIFRVFERGGRNINSLFPEIGLPNSLGQTQRLEEPGRPDIRQSNRGPGTGLRIAVPAINLHKTRLNDPLMWFQGTNDQPGDYRQSGCAGCHVVYANDRDPRHSSIYAKFGHGGLSQQADPTIPKDRPGHPLKHAFTRQIPTSQCMVCHMHQPNLFMNTYLGYTMWDYESDAPAMWPEKQAYPTDAEVRAINDRNPEGAAVRGKWGDVEFLKRVSELNPTLKDTQFADYHGHGWNFRAIHKRDRKGNLLDKDGNKVDANDPEKWKKAVHMSSIHVDVGMQCVDCHFAQDGHGTGMIHGEVSSAIEITCKDCHGTSQALPTLKTSGPAARPGGFDLASIRNADGKRRFEWVGDKLVQRSAVKPGLEWEMSLVKNTVDPNSPHYNAKAARAKLMSKDTATQAWGPGVAPQDLAHKDEEMACFTCHLSWTTSCGGCHLPIEANWKTPLHRYEGGETRNYATYNPQVAREDMFQLGKHGPDKDGQVAPFASRSALVLSSTNINRERLYIQQPPIAASGYSSQAFAPHYPHTERKEETKTCTDCHLSTEGDNNAIMAQLLLHGTKYVDFVGFFAWVGADGGVEAVRVTEWDEPQAVVGSYLHRYAYPDWFKEHVDRGRELKTDGTREIDSVAKDAGRASCIQMRGEYLYVSEGKGGFQVYDIASVANKGVSEKILTGPFSPLGHDTHVPTKNATCVVLPTTQPIAPNRNEGELMRVTNMEQPMHPIYRHAYVTDAEEGLVGVDITTLTDGDPQNNFLERDLTFNPGGLLTGARHLAIAGTTFYVVADKGVVVLDMDQPKAPKVLATIPLDDARAAAVQFRYLFVTTSEGLRVVDVTTPAKPRLVQGALVPLADARKLHVARTYAYVAAGKDGLAIIDVEKPEKAFLYQAFNAGGTINDAYDVVVASTNASLFAYVADGKNGLKVLQLTSPASQPNFYGFSPEPKPELIAWRKTVHPALSLSRGLERDRAVDETGHQIAVVGRKGSRPFTLEEQKQLYLDKAGKPWAVTDRVVKESFKPADTTPKPVPAPPAGEGGRRKPGEGGPAGQGTGPALPPKDTSPSPPPEQWRRRPGVETSVQAGGGAGAAKDGSVGAMR